MKINDRLAQNIVDKTMDILGKNINIMDEHGIIIGSGNRKRLMQFHEGAAQVIKEGKKLEIYSKDINHLFGAKPGINLPIEYNNKIIGVVGITGEPNEVSPFGEVIKMMVEMMLQQEILLKELHLEHQARENFIDDLISGRTGNDLELFVTRGQIIGYDIFIPRIALVIDIYQFEEKSEKSLQELSRRKEGEIHLQKLKNNVLKAIQGLFKNSPQEIVSYTGGGRFVILKTIDLKDSDQILRENIFKISACIKDIIIQKMGLRVSVGIGEYHQGINGLRKSFKEATLALILGTKLERAGDIYHIDNLGIGTLLSKIPDETQQDFMKHTIHSKRNIGRKEINKTLLRTLKSYFDHNLSISKTAKSIFIHRNTLLYRLRKVKEITGLDPKNFDDAVQLRIALKMRVYQSGKK